MTKPEIEITTSRHMRYPGGISSTGVEYMGIKVYMDGKVIKTKEIKISKQHVAGPL